MKLTIQQALEQAWEIERATWKMINEENEHWKHLDIGEVKAVRERLAKASVGKFAQAHLEQLIRYGEVETDGIDVSDFDAFPEPVAVPQVK